MKKNKISKTKDYLKMGEFWDSHDLTEYWDQTEPVHFDVHLEKEQSYFGVEKELSKRIFTLAKRRGVSPHTLVNLWLQEKLIRMKAA